MSPPANRILVNSYLWSEETGGECGSVFVARIALAADNEAVVVCLGSLQGSEVDGGYRAEGGGCHLD